MRRKIILTNLQGCKRQRVEVEPGSDSTSRRSSDKALLAGLQVKDESRTCCGALTGRQGSPGPAGQEGLRPFT